MGIYGAASGWDHDGNLDYTSISTTPAIAVSDEQPSNDLAVSQSRRIRRLLVRSRRIPPLHREKIATRAAHRSVEERKRDRGSGDAGDTMADDQISLPYLAAILVVSGLIIRYLFFSGPSVPRTTRSPEAFLRSREAAVERIQQMFPQAERRSILWDLQRNGGNIQNTTERILAGRLDTPPVTFQPPPPPGQAASSSSSASVTRQPEKPAQPDLISRYNLKDKIVAGPQPDGAGEAETDKAKKGKGWSSNRDERQASLQRRRDEMILAARRKMEARMAAEKATQVD
ncbi:AMFR protein [Purpureocillium lavendulum]|uniref:Coupling of ubiquitin conjugation to ER degradation protein 1 n=1 Tax=Purpureocillium lavendulum TaxID=1247861 RepID=A0AB34G1R7_9HYPO|nr:AMFR protein [Purpureocillium lavendulum]